MNKARVILPFSAALLTTFAMNAQQVDPVQRIRENVTNQVAVYPQEKIHLHTDKNQYVNGERLWLRAHLVNAATHVPDTSSRYVYVELIDSQDSVVTRKRIRHLAGSYEGYIDLDENLAQGEYLLRAYTYFLRSQGDDYFFKKKIFISDPLLAKMKTEVDFSYRENGNSLIPTLTFRNATDLSVQPPLSFSISLGDTEPYYTETDRNGSVSAGFRVRNRVGKQVLKAKYNNHGIFIPVPAPDPDFEVGFYPEGGNLVAGAMMSVALKALNEDGNALAVSGEVLDSEDNYAASFSTLHDGMGMFQFIPEAGKTYYALCTAADGRTKRVELPAPASHAVGLAVQRVNGSVAVSLLRSPDSHPAGPFYFLMHTRGILIFASEWPRPDHRIVIDESEFPSGVIQCLLLDGEMNPVSERLIFCNNDDQATVELALDKPAYGIRSRIRTGMTVSDGSGNPLSGALSVSVTDNRDVPPDTANNILATFLLTSELPGTIEDPAFYFRKGDRLAAMASDLLMMTHGWRRYDLPQTLRGQLQLPSYPLEAGQEVSGRVTNVGGEKPVKDARVSLLSGRYFDSAVTDEQGRFVFNGFELQDSTGISVSAKTDKGRTHIAVRVDPEDFPEKTTFSLSPFAEQMEKIHTDYILKADRKYINENGMRLIDLEEIQIVADRSRDDRYLLVPDKMVSKILREEDLENIPNLDYLTSLIPGSFMEDDSLYLRYRRGQKAARIFINSFPAEDWQQVTAIPVSDVSRIDVIKDEMTATSFYGTGAQGGVIHIILKNDYANYQRPTHNVSKFIPLGYQRHAEFYSPQYDTQEKLNDGRPDLRTTVYWNPNVRITDGKAGFEFYSADSQTTYTILVEGVADNGKIIYGLREVTVGK